MTKNNPKTIDANFEALALRLVDLQEVLMDIEIRLQRIERSLKIIWIKQTKGLST